MVKQYSKFAQGTCNIKKTTTKGAYTDIFVPFNLTFNPTLVFLECKCGNREFCFSSGMGEIYFETEENYQRDNGKVSVVLESKTRCKLRILLSLYAHNFVIKKWYAIA